MGQMREDQSNHRSSKKNTLLRPGENCWRLENANRLGVVIDGQDYFSAFRSACSRARQTIYILGWDFDRLEKIGRAEDDPSFEEYLCGLLDQNSELHIYLLLWDFNMIYAAEREWFQAWRLRLGRSSNLHVHFDDRHPVGASHHQKIVVVDDAVAFCGGFDLSRWRWDTPEHQANDSRRKDADGKSYPPFHDMMCVVDDAAARALGELARTRWEISASTDVALQPDRTQHDPWPKEVEPLFSDQPVAIARTFPMQETSAAVLEVKQLFLDSIASAKSYIYIENQYFTSSVITNALVERLQHEDSPEMLLVLPQHTGGWLEQVTMDELRHFQLERLRAADKHQKLQIYYPVQPGLPDEECISVHAKLMITDDCFVHIGSANTSDRSMGLDSECDLAWEAPDDAGVPWLLHRMLSEHLGCDIEAIEKARTSTGSLAEAIASLQRPGERTLEMLVGKASTTELELNSDSDLLDPIEPIHAEYFVRRAVPDAHSSTTGRRQLLFFLGFIVLLLLLAAAWRWTPLSNWVSPEKLSEWLQWFEQPWLRFVAVLVLVVVASLLMLPLTLLVIASSLLLGPWSGFACSMLGALASGWIAFLLGELLGGRVLQRLSGSQIHKLSQRLSERGILAVAMLRLLPVAPYTVVNLAAGASHLKQGQFMVGSAIGLLPGIGALTVFSGSLAKAIRNPSLESLGAAAVFAVVIVIAALLLRRMLKPS